VSLQSIVRADFSDIQGIELECIRCHARLSLPLHQDQVKIAPECPQCSDKWADDNTAFNDVRSVAETLRNARTLQPARFHFRFLLPPHPESTTAL